MSRQSQDDAEREIRQARANLLWLRARYDDGAVSAAMYQSIKQLESDIAWAQHRTGRT